MSLGRRWCSVTLVIVTSWTMTACGDDPPNKEIQQAQQAIDAARTSGADRYAGDEFTAAQEALKRAQAAVAARDYRQALNKKARAKTDADRTLRDTALALVDARAKLRAAEVSRRPPRLVIALRRDIADAETRVQEARTAFEKGDYLDAGELLEKTRTRLEASVRILEGTGRR
jgi:hypothetical protein